MDDETIFFPFRGEHPHLDDVHKAHSWLTIEGERFCLGKLAGCRFCRPSSGARL